MKKQINKKTIIKLFPLASLLVGLVLSVSTVVAYFAVTDNAGEKEINIALQETTPIYFLNADGSTFTTKYVLAGGTISSSVGTPTYTDDNDLSYVFDGWATDNVNYTKVSDYATKTYNNSVTYYPRFARFGYSLNGGAPKALANNKDDLVSLSTSCTLSLGTIVHNKASLEYAASATISNAGDYALVCGNENSTWSSASASSYSDINNWSVQRYLTVTSNSLWDGLKLYARINKASTHQDEFLTNIDGYSYYVFVDYDAVSINFGGVASNVETLPSNLNDTPKHLDAIALGNTSSFSLDSTTTYYLTGSFGSVNWSKDSNYVLTQDSSNSSVYTISDVALTAGDKFKVVTNTNNWYSDVDPWTNCGFTIDGSDLVISNTGVYDISINTAATNGNYVYISGVETTFRLTNTTSAVSYIGGSFTSWQPVEMTSVGNNVYEYKVKLAPNATDYEYKFILKLGGNYYRDFLNADNRHINVASTISASEEVTDTKTTITFTANWNDASTMIVTGDFNGYNWSTSSGVTLTGVNGVWSGSTQVDLGTSGNFKFVINGSNWQPSNNIYFTADKNKTIHLNDYL